MKKSLMIFLTLLPLKSVALGPPSISANQDGVKHYESEDYAGAFKDFASALSKDAYNPTFHFNLGDAFLKNGDIGKAIDEYESVDKSPKASPDLKFKALFNAGNAAIQNKDIPKALSFYQRALEFKPDSNEVKTNIELALKDPQGGGGGGGDKDKKDKKDQDQKDQKDKQNKDQKDQNDKKDDKGQQQNEEKPKPKPFQSKDLNEGDVRRILEELKRQEEQIRAKQNIDNKKTPEKPIDKDW